MNPVFVGYDGFIDRMVRPVCRRIDAEHAQYFPTIADFASYLAQAAGRSADIELTEFSRRCGGNAPLLADALADLAVPVTCYALAEPEDPAWKRFSPAVELHPLGPCALCTAYEFNDGKLMFAELDAMHRLTWEHIVAVAGEDALRQTLSCAPLVALTDWSNGAHMTEIWRQTFRLLEEEKARPRIFLDLADPYKRKPEEILELCRLLRTRDNLRLGVNENEARLLCAALKLPQGAPEDMASDLAKALGLTLVLHTVDAAYSADEQGIAYAPGRRCDKPVLTTGGGDHFNAGYCAAWLRDADPAGALAAGNQSANHYVSTGQNLRGELAFSI